MTSSLEGSPQSIRDLVPKNASLEPRSLERIRNLPHLQRVAGLVFLLLEAESVSREQFKDEFEKFRDANLNGIKISLRDFVLSAHVNPMWSLSDQLNNKKLPEIIAEKLNEHGNPFGFGQEVTRAILEMANDTFETQLGYDSVKIGSYDPNWNPNPIDYLEETMIRMFEEGHLSGMTPVSKTKFPAGDYHREIFPRPVAQQMEKYIKQRYS